MATWQRIGVALIWSLGLMVAGVLYNEVFMAELVPVVDPEGTFSQPVTIMEVLIPIILLVLLLAAWIWVIAGAVQDERTITRRRVR